ncbi:MAG TPA: glycosyltransferase [Gaiellaceae bacterium]|nr:glycosyltransferase [Gaiellaceae bacterium]
MPDLAVIVVSHDQERWLPRCLSTLLEHAQGLSLDLVVVDNGATGAARELVERDFPQARAIASENRGFAHACNLAAATCDAHWLLFLNPDTEVLKGSLAGLIAGLAPQAGIAGVRQVDDTGALIPTMRMFPSAMRALGDSLGLERFPRRPVWLGERELRLELYDRESEGDWTIGSFLLIRREAFDAVRGFDDRFFLYSEEVDLCLRVRKAGWKVVHNPAVTIRHHGNSERPADPRLQAQLAWAQLQYADKNLPALSRPVLRGALLLRYGVRSLHGDTRRRGAARAATSVLLGRRPPPFESRRPAPPPVDRLAPGLEPGVIGATGGSGTRVLAAIAQRGGMFIGADLNRSLDALDFAAFFDRWVGREPSPDAAAELRALVARQHAEAGGRPWGWKEPRSVYLLPFLDAELPGLRFLHVVRDGRDMAFSENQVQLRKHGEAVLGRTDEPEALRSIALWREVNLRAADFGERELGDRYLRIRFEDLCAEPAARVAEVLGFFGLEGNAEQIAAAEVQAPSTLGRWREADPELQAALSERAADALERFGYQASSE